MRKRKKSQEIVELKSLEEEKIPSNDEFQLVLNLNPDKDNSLKKEQLISTNYLSIEEIQSRRKKQLISKNYLNIEEVKLRRKGH